MSVGFEIGFTLQFTWFTIWIGCSLQSIARELKRRPNVKPDSEMKGG